MATPLATGAISPYTTLFRSMGTTIVSTLVAGDKAYVGHVGDSRVYRVREGQIAQLTRDHSLLEDYKEAKPDMTEEEDRKSTRLNSSHSSMSYAVYCVNKKRL